MHTRPSSVKSNFENWNGMLKLIQKMVDVVNTFCYKTWSNDPSNYRQLAVCKSSSYVSCLSFRMPYAQETGPSLFQLLVTTVVQYTGAPRAVRQYSRATSAIWVRMYPPHCTLELNLLLPPICWAKTRHRKGTLPFIHPPADKKKEKDRLISFTVTELGKYE